MALNDVAKERFVRGEMDINEKIVFLSEITSDDSSLDDFLGLVEQMPLTDTPQGFTSEILRPKAEGKEQIKMFNLKVICVMAATLAVIFAGTYSFSAKMGDTSLVQDKKAVSRFIERTNEKLSSFFDFSNWEVTKNDK